MSHYAVAVFSDDPSDYAFDRLLEPYNEQDKNYFIFKEISEDKLENEYQSFLEYNPSYKPYTIDQYIKDHGYIVQNGKVGYMYNPNAKWDWYTLDGKDYLFEPKKFYIFDPDVMASRNGRYKKSELDFFKEDKEEIKRAKKFWNDYVIKNNPNTKSIYTREYFLERYKTKEQYVKEVSRTVPYAFITPDGEWHAPGEVGWFGCSDETDESSDKYYEEWIAFINDDSNDPFVSIVDCHI